MFACSLQIPPDRFSVPSKPDEITSYQAVCCISPGEMSKNVSRTPEHFGNTLTTYEKSLA
jgi:hypothetical protein